MGGLGYIAYTMASNSMQATIQQQLKKETANTSALVEKSIESVKQSLEVASLNRDLGKAAQNLSEADIDTAYEYIQNVQKNNKESIEELIITDVNGKVVIDSDTKKPDIDLGDRDYMKKNT